MTESSLEEVVLESSRFQSTLRLLARDAVIADLPAVTPVGDASEIDWGFALLCSSALTSNSGHGGQEAALRVAHSCLASNADSGLREAAVVILERLGNRQSLGLATRRGLVEDDTWLRSPPAIIQDVIRRRLELTIAVADGGDIRASNFQRQFWSAASTTQWLSVSAPTSAGKSFIVKRWLEDRASRQASFNAVYVVPTRALIEEVSLDLIDDLADLVQVHTMPWDSEIGHNPKEVFVLTQERFHLLQQRSPALKPDLVFIDEAQKFDDGARGILLQQVLDETVRRAPAAQIIFASPLTTNPEILLSGAPAGQSRGSLNSEAVTVNQNLLLANQVKGRPRRWTLELVSGSQITPCGSFELAARPTPASQRLPLVAVTLGGSDSGNVVYANGAADAEKAAKQIYEALGAEADASSDTDIAALRELVRSAVHPQYALIEVLQRRVAFHYGNMPLLLKSEIERLFKEGQLRYLVCTSTLLEGVNLPCKNLFVRGPRKGLGKVMTAADFWNLAGRAGRWGKEFQGNIVCVDTTDARQWPSPPATRARQPIARASATALADQPALLAYIDAGTPLSSLDGQPLLEPMFSLLASRVAQGFSPDTIVGLDIGGDAAALLNESVRQALEDLTFPLDLIGLHAGISPLSMQRLLDTFATYTDPSVLVLPTPESNDAAATYVRAISLVNETLGGTWGPAGRQFQLAILIVEWMQGLPLARLVGSRIAYARRNNNTNIPSIIRMTMSDVEQVARFQAPKYLSCYQDLLRVHLRQIGRDDLDDGQFDVSMMLELGVSRRTEVSLMALGLSRTTTIALAELIIEDELTPQAALEWLRLQDLDAMALPELVRREAKKRLAAAPDAG